MADIKQAAKWMQEGKAVVSSLGLVYTANEDGLIIFYDNNEEPVNFFIEEMLDEGWEIYQD